MSDLFDKAAALFAPDGYASRYGKRLLSSIPAAAEEAFLSATDPVGTVEDLVKTAEQHLLKYYFMPGGGERLKQDAYGETKGRLTSPEWAADATVDLASLLLAKKAPGLRNMTADDYAVAGKFGVQQAANGYENPPALGERAGQRIAEGYSALKTQGDADPRAKQIQNSGLASFLFGL